MTRARLHYSPHGLTLAVLSLSCILLSCNTDRHPIEPSSQTSNEHLTLLPEGAATIYRERGIGRTFRTLDFAFLNEGTTDVRVLIKGSQTKSFTLPSQTGIHLLVSLASGDSVLVESLSKLVTSELSWGRADVLRGPINNTIRLGGSVSILRNLLSPTAKEVKAEYWVKNLSSTELRVYSDGRDLLGTPIAPLEIRTFQCSLEPGHDVYVRPTSADSGSFQFGRKHLSIGYGKRSLDSDSDSTVTTVLGPEGGTIEFLDFARVTFPQGSLVEDHSITLKAVSESATDSLFESTAPLFDEVFRASYELRIAVSPAVQPLSDVLVDLVVPSDLGSDMSQILVYGLLHQDDGQEELLSFSALSGVTENPEGGVSIQLAPWFFTIGPSASEAECVLILAGTSPLASRTSSLAASTYPCYGISMPCALSSDWVIDSEYKMRLFQGKWRAHCGLDIRALEGTPVYAVDAGEVLPFRCSDIDAKGIAIRIKHSYGETRYYHLRNRFVSPGRVEKGDIIGLSGSTKECSGTPGGYHPHLHFEFLPTAAIKDPDLPGLTPICRASQTDPQPCISGTSEKGRIFIVPDVHYMRLGDTLQLRAELRNQAGRVMGRDLFVWKAIYPQLPNPAILSVDNAGLVQTLGEGQGGIAVELRGATPVTNTFIYQDYYINVDAFWGNYVGTAATHGVPEYDGQTLKFAINFLTNHAYSGGWGFEGTYRGSPAFGSGCFVSTSRSGYTIAIRDCQDPLSPRRGSITLSGNSLTGEIPFGRGVATLTFEATFCRTVVGLTCND